MSRAASGAGGDRQGGGGDGKGLQDRAGAGGGGLVVEEPFLGRAVGVGLLGAEEEGVSSRGVGRRRLLDGRGLLRVIVRYVSWGAMHETKKGADVGVATGLRQNWRAERAVDTLRIRLSIQTT